MQWKPQEGHTVLCGRFCFNYKNGGPSDFIATNDLSKNTSRWKTYYFNRGMSVNKVASVDCE